MKSEQLMTLALRVVAVIIAAYACVDLTNVAGFLLMELHVIQQNITTSATFDLKSLGWDAVIMWAIPVITAVSLWWLAPRLAKLACRESDQVVNFSGFDMQRLAIAAFVLVGFWIAVFGLIGLVGIGVNELQMATNSQLAGGPFDWGDFATYLLRCLFGLAVAAGGHNLSRLLLRLRTAGT